MTSSYEIETAAPSLSRCDCCGGTTVRLTRFVTRDGDAFAIYYAGYANHHPDELAMIVSLGDWSEDADPSGRAAFYCRVRPTEDSYQVMLDDAAGSVWADAEILGQKLTRADAIAHPWKASAFEVLDAGFAQDPSLIGWLHRVQSDDAAVPLERSFGAPDAIFALGDAVQGRAACEGSFASLDAARFFVRCLLTIPVEGYDTWSVGAWVEVTRATCDEVRAAWDDLERYPALRFAGAIANDLEPALDQPVPIGTSVELYVPDADAPPRVARPSSGPLAALLAVPWARADFETFAYAHGYL